ncbi:hypothetical protein [Neorhizobium petrolearium]
MAKNAMIGVLIAVVVMLIAAFLMRGVSSLKDESPTPTAAPSRL